MGDRGNIVLRSNGEEVWLYSHWNGSFLPEILEAAMKRGKGRWDDPSYLARIIFSEMIRDDINGETGFGIWPSELDGGTTLFVDIDRKIVSDDDGNEWSFEEYTS